MNAARMSARSGWWDLPGASVVSIIEYLDWVDLERLDSALVNHEARKNYLEALTLRNVSVEGIDLWNRSLRKGMLH